MIRNIANRRTSSNRATRRRVANAVINSRLFYGIEITCRELENLVDVQSPTYNNTVRALSGLLPSTPGSSACVEAGILPFRHRAILALCYRAISYLEKARNVGQVCFLIEQANRALNDVASSTLPPVARVHRIGPRSWKAREPTLDTAMKLLLRKGANPTQAKVLFTERIRSQYLNANIRYSDGSKAAGTVGVGVFSSTWKAHYSLPSQCSVFSAEAAALFKAIARPSDKPILVVTDSASVLQALESPTSKHPWIQAAQNILNDRNRRITLTWVPGHTGIHGNEQADLLANQGRTSRRLYRRVPGADAKLWINHIIHNAWAEEWRSNRSLLLRKIKGSTKPWEDRANWKEPFGISRLRTGHTKTSHDFSSNSSFRKTCDTCGTRNTVEHILCECPALEQLRTLYQMGSIRNVLQNDQASETTLISFLKDAGLFALI